MFFSNSQTRTTKVSCSNMSNPIAFVDKVNTSREVDNETMAGVNSRFAEVTEDDILRMQDIKFPTIQRKLRN